LVTLARERDVLPVGIVLDLRAKVSAERNRDRGVPFGDNVVRRQVDQLRRSLRHLGREGLRHIHHLASQEDIDAAQINRTKLYTDKRDEPGPFDVIGDVHGCMAELTELLERLGYQLVLDAAGRAIDATPPVGRTAIFLGDLIDRGPRVVDVLRLAMGMTAAGHALAVPIRSSSGQRGD
jgi:protein phosphatase